MSTDKLNITRRILQRCMLYALCCDCRNFDGYGCEKCPYPESMLKASKGCVEDAAEQIVRLFEEGT